MKPAVDEVIITTTTTASVVASGRSYISVASLTVQSIVLEANDVGTVLWTFKKSHKGLLNAHANYSVHYQPHASIATTYIGTYTKIIDGFLIERRE